MARKKGVAIGFVDDTEMGLILAETIENMTNLGFWHPEFAPLVKRYAQTRVERDMLFEKWVNEGRIETETYTNKAGATNIVEANLKKRLDKIDAQLLDMEDALGLTVRSYKQLKGEIEEKGAKTPKIAGIMKRLDSMCFTGEENEEEKI